ncbi:MAG: phosphotransacetylase family protein [Anaerolineales bacterium]
MKALYVTSVEPYSGKTAVCLALGKLMQADGLRVAYLKPVSTQPWRTPEGELADEDAAFVQSTLGLDAEVPSLSPIIITPSTLREHLKGIAAPDRIERIQKAARAAAKGHDVLLLEGGASLCDGYTLGLDDLRLAKALSAPAVVVVRYRGEMRILDDSLTANWRLGEQLMGLILNQIPEQHRDFVRKLAIPYLENENITVLGSLPRVARLSALSLGELAEVLKAQVLTETYDPQALAETFTVGAMTADQALSRFRRYQNKAVITGGDRTDIQLAALETSTVVLILTGNLHPSPLIIQQAESLHIPILLVNQNTMETVESIERAYGKTRLGQHEKLDTFMQLMKDNVNVGAIYKGLGLS